MYNNDFSCVVLGIWDQIVVDVLSEPSLRSVKVFFEEEACAVVLGGGALGGESIRTGNLQVDISFILPSCMFPSQEHSQKGISD